MTLSRSGKKFYFCNFFIGNDEGITMKLNELVTHLNGLAAQLDKASAEILKKIGDLEAALSDAGIPDEAMAVIEALKAKAQALDDIVPDAPPPVEA